MSQFFKSRTLFEKIWEKISVFTVKYILGFFTRIEVYDSFWTFTPRNHKHLIIITDRIPFLPKNFRGGMNFNILFSCIMKKYRSDFGLIQHECTHADQARRDGIFKHFFEYKFKPWRRYALEIEGYKVSMKYGMTARTASSLILNNDFYHLDCLHLSRNKVEYDLIH